MKHISYKVPFTSYNIVTDNNTIETKFIMGKRTNQSIRLFIKDNKLNYNYVDNSFKHDYELDVTELLKAHNIEELLTKNILKRKEVN